MPDSFGKIEVDAEARQLFDFCLKEKMRASGLLGRQPAVYLLQPVVEEFTQATMGLDTRYKMRIKVNLNKAADLERVWSQEVIYEWRNKRVNDQIGDQLSSLVAEQVGWALLGPGVEIGSIDQEFTDFGDTTREMRLDPQTRGLLRFYMEEKLGAVGLSADGLAG